IRRKNIKWELDKKKTIFVLISGFVLLWSVLFFTYWVIGGMPPDRTMNFLLFIFCLYWIVLLIYISQYIRPVVCDLLITRKYAIPVSFVCLFFLFFMNNNTSLVWSDLITGKAAA